MPPTDIVERFGVTDPTLVARTDIALVWQVSRGGQAFALKVYNGRDMRNEDAGFELIRACNGQAAVYVLDQAHGAVLMEWLGGPSLGDMVRAGEDAGAAGILGEVAGRLHRAAGQVTGLPLLEDWVKDLFGLRFAPDCPLALRRDIGTAQGLARDLLATATDIAPLHGDLHHDNVKQGPRGWCAFDAKGVLGDRTYEMANAFRNPKGADAFMRSPDRIQHLATLWADGLGLDRSRLLQWAAAKCALSIAWRSGPLLTEDAEADLLAVMLAQATAV